jgi:ring-1,2-phenylacetyl-CoA epoxidase subunit PaaC
MPAAKMVDPRMPTTSDTSLFDYLLRLADSDLILAQHLGEWIGHGPVLEEDIALTNVGLDLLGQARMWFGYAGDVEARIAGRGRGEDELAFLREAAAFRNLLLVEQPNGDYAQTIARQFYFDVWHQLLLSQLAHSRDVRVAEIAAKGWKEVRYHVERSAGWVVRLGDGTAQSHAKMQAAIDDLWMYTGEMFEADAIEQALIAEGIACDAPALAPAWRDQIGAVLQQATLVVPTAAWMQSGGRRGVHTEHLGHLLAEMQSVQRAYPGARW